MMQQLRKATLLRLYHAAKRNIDSSSQPSSGKLVLHKRERRRAKFDRVALVHGGVVTIAAERIRRVTVRLNVGRERALEASRARRELNIPMSAAYASKEDCKYVRQRPGTFRR